MTSVQVLRDDTGTVVPYASIQGLNSNQKPTGIGVTADKNGDAEIDAYVWLSNGVKYLKTSSVGYSPVTDTLADKGLAITIRLPKNEIELGGVTVTSTKHKVSNIILIVLLALILLSAVVYGATKKK